MSENEEIYVGYKFKMYPLPEQEEILKQYFGAARYVYNLGIDLQNKQQKEYDLGNEKYKTLSYFSLNTKLSELKKLEDYKWLKDFDSFSLTLVMKDLSIAYKRYFEGKSSHPKYKKKKWANQSFPIRSERMSIDNNFVKIPSIGNIYICNHKHPECIGTGFKETRSKKYSYKHYYSARISFDGYSYWLTFTLKQNKEENITFSSCKRFINNEIWKFKDYTDPIGIDVGCRYDNWIVDSRGNRIYKPNTNKEDKQIAKYNKKMNTKQKVNNKVKITNLTVANELEAPNYTKNEEKILKKLNKALKRKTNKKLAIIHDYACSIINDKPSSVIMEDLDVIGMMNKGKRANRQINDSLLYNISLIIKQKCEDNAIPFILADKEFPSTQLCSKCGFRQKIGTKRIYQCPCCANTIDRDLNAALNLSYIGYANYNQYSMMV